ncbi:MAG: hypothetical protein U0Q07_06150 [Acidimicrobiales bacterium]
MTTTGDARARRIDVRDESLGGVLDRRLDGRFEVDPWGYDRDLAGVVGLVARARWDTALDGADLVPRGGALVVHDQGLDPATPAILAAAFARHLGRTVRPVGQPDWSPLGPWLARLGMVPRTAADTRALLRAGALVAVPLGRSWRGEPSSFADLDLVAAAHAVGAPLLPVAVGGRLLGRRRPVVVGAPVPTRRRRRIGAADALAAEIADRVVALADLADLED